MLRMGTMIREISIGGGIAIIAALFFNGIRLFTPGFWYSQEELKLTFSLIAMLYTGCVLYNAKTKVGWIIVSSVFVLATLCSFALNVHIIFHGPAQLVWIWAIRSLYHHDSFVVAFADGILVILAAFWASIVMALSNSMFLGVWGFFLAQSLYIYLPLVIPKGVGSVDSIRKERSSLAGDRFQSSFQAAEAALRELASRG